MKVGIIGAGTMGSGIAQVVAKQEHDVHVFDTNAVVLEKAQKQLQEALEKLVLKNKFTEIQAKNLFSRIIWTDKLSDLSQSELVIEAIIENIEIKKKLFEQLEEIVNEDCILASNTSSLSLTWIASACKNPGRFIGIHFFNPAPLMKLVEVIPALQTNETIVKRTKSLVESWGKTVVIAKDTPGFIVNKVARPFYSEAIKLFEEGVAEIQFIDGVMTSNEVGFKMGPFALMDLIGHDVNYKVTETVWTSFYYDPKYRPSFTQKRLVEANWLGKKTGKGFYEYPQEMKDVVFSPDMQPIVDEVKNRIVHMIINEAADTLYLGIASKEDIDTAMTLGVNYPKGPLAWADQIGISNCVNYLDDLHKRFGDDRYRCCPLLRTMASQNKSFY